MTALAAALAEVGQAIEADARMVAKLHPRRCTCAKCTGVPEMRRVRPCESCGFVSCPTRDDCEDIATRREAADDRADDVERRHDRALDRELEGGCW